MTAESKKTSSYEGKVGLIRVIYMVLLKHKNWSSEVSNVDKTRYAHSSMFYGLMIWIPQG